MNKKIFPIFIIIVLVVLVLSIPSIIELFENKGKRQSGKENPTYKRISESIKAIDTLKWDASLYQSILTDINAVVSSGSLKQGDKELLVENMDGYYIPKLVAASKQFYGSVCNDRALLNTIGKELQRYNTPESKEMHKQLTKEMNEKIYATWYLIGTGTKTIKYKIDALGDYDRNEYDSVHKEMVEKSNANYLRSCSMVKDAVKDYKNTMGNKHFKYVEKAVNDYLSEDNYELHRHRQVADVIREYIQKNYVGNSSLCNGNADPLFKRMDTFYKGNRN